MDKEKIIESSYQLDIGSLEEKMYTALITQFTFICFFSPYLIIAGLVSYVINLIVIILTITIYTEITRRPIPRRTKDIGIWNSLYNFVGYIGIIYNALIIIRNTEGVKVVQRSDSELSDSQNSTFIYNVQSFLLLLKFLLSIIIPPLPAWIYNRMTNEKITNDKIKKNNAKMLVHIGKELGGVDKDGKLDKSLFESGETKSLKYYFKNKEKVHKFMGLDLNEQKPFVEVKK